jgi:hypothetical protein
MVLLGCGDEKIDPEQIPTRGRKKISMEGVSVSLWIDRESNVLI